MTRRATLSLAWRAAERSARARFRPSRFHVGDRVTVITGPFRGAGGRITGVHDGLRFTVLFEDWHKVGDSRHLLAPVFADDLGNYVVPPEARPVSVGALMRGSR